jgi:uncharacterized protein (DUF2141 family)
MNYLTNYYKNLSEKLQHRVNLLENQAKMINEAVSTMSVYDRGRASTDAFGGSGVPGDYNGDGVVDGYDLGIALGNYGQPGYDFQNTLQNWTQQTGAPAAYRSTTRGTGSGRPSNTRDKGGSVASKGPNFGMGGNERLVGDGRTNVSPYSLGGMGGGGGIPGDYNGDGRVDGYDLGIALGNYGQPGFDYNSTLQNWSQSQPPRMAQRMTRSSTRNSLSAAGEVEPMAPSSTGIPGDYNGDGRVDGADLGLALGNYGQPGYDFNTTLQNWTGSGNVGGGSRPSFRSPRPSNIRPKEFYRTK